MDPIGWFIATLHSLIGHDKAAAFLQVPVGDKTQCLICQHERRPTEATRAAVVRALRPPDDA